MPLLYSSAPQELLSESPDRCAPRRRPRRLSCLHRRLLSVEDRVYFALLNCSMHVSTSSCRSAGLLVFALNCWAIISAT